MFWYLRGNFRFGREGSEPLVPQARPKIRLLNGPFGLGQRGPGAPAPLLPRVLTRPVNCFMKGPMKILFLRATLGMPKITIYNMIQKIYRGTNTHQRPLIDRRRKNTLLFSVIVQCCNIDYTPYCTLQVQVLILYQVLLYYRALCSVTVAVHSTQCSIIQ